MKQELLPACLMAFACLATARTPAPFDIAINGARMIDPESKLDAIRHVGIRGAKIAAVSAAPLTAKRAPSSSTGIAATRNWRAESPAKLVVETYTRFASEEEALWVHGQRLALVPRNALGWLAPPFATTQELARLDATRVLKRS